jgi:hypothetical protein
VKEPFAVDLRKCLFVYFLMTVKKRSPTLDLKVGDQIFPVKKTVLLEKLGLFQDNPSLLGGPEYEVRSRVSPEIFSMFVRILRGGSIKVSRSTVESFRLLAEEFDFESLSAKCAKFSASHRHCRVSSLITEVKSSRGALPCVTITIKGRCYTYEVLRSAPAIREFMKRLTDADEEGIKIDGIGGGEDVIEKAISTVYWNSMATLPDDDTRKQSSAVILWLMYKNLSWYEIDSRICCLNLLHEIIPTTFDVAKLLISSQCDPTCPEDYLPLPEADWSVIGCGTEVLRAERSEKKDEANDILRRLKRHGRWGALKLIQQS